MIKENTKRRDYIILWQAEKNKWQLGDRTTRPQNSLELNTSQASFYGFWQFNCLSFVLFHNGLWKWIILWFSVWYLSVVKQLNLWNIFQIHFVAFDDFLHQKFIKLGLRVSSPLDPVHDHNEDIAVENTFWPSWMMFSAHISKDITGDWYACICKCLNLLMGLYCALF